MIYGEYVTLDDPRVTLKSTPSPYRVKTVPGAVDGYHNEPRMPNVHVSTKCWAMIPGDFAEITVENIPLIGIVYEAAEHHYDADIIINDRNFYGDKRAYLLSGYMPSSDGYGRVHWILIPRTRNKVRVQITESYNRMLDLTKAYPTKDDLREAGEFCLSGFILMDNIVFPPPTYGSWCFRKMQGEDFLFTPNTLKIRKIPVQEVLEVPPEGFLYLMDLYGQGSLDFMNIRVDHKMRMDIFDGGPSSPTWSRQIQIPSEIKGVFSLTKTRDGRYTVEMSRRILFGNRLLVRLFNADDKAHNLLDVFMEGSLRLM